MAIHRPRLFTIGLAGMITSSMAAIGQPVDGLDVISARELEYQATLLTSDKEFLAIIALSDGLLKINSGDASGTDLVVWSSEKLKDVDQTALGIVGLDAANQRGAFFDPLFYVRKRAALVRASSPDDAAAALKICIDQALTSTQPRMEIYLAARDLLTLRQVQGSLSPTDRQTLVAVVRLNQNPQGFDLVTKRQLLLDLIEDAWKRRDYPLAAELQGIFVTCIGDMWKDDGNRVLWNLLAARRGRSLSDMDAQDFVETKSLWSDQIAQLYPEWLLVFNNLIGAVQWSQPEGISMIQESLRVAKEQLPSWLVIAGGNPDRRERIDSGIADLIHIGSQHAKMNCSVLRDLLATHETAFPASPRRALLDHIKPRLLADCP